MSSCASRSAVASETTRSAQPPAPIKRKINRDHEQPIILLHVGWSYFDFQERVRRMSVRSWHILANLDLAMQSWDTLRPPANLQDAIRLIGCRGKWHDCASAQPVVQPDDAFRHVSPVPAKQQLSTAFALLITRGAPFEAFKTVGKQRSR
jgi:hypothetical protein